MQFLDTNVLLYSVSADAKEAEKAAIAADLLQLPDLAISIQVLQEFFVQVTRSTRLHRLPHEVAHAFVESWLRFPVQEMTVEILVAALKSSQRYKISYWDAAIIESARKLECNEVLSEDLNDGQNYGGVRVVNPFRHSNGKKRRPH
ncbi:MAG TPA: PIN domain-containing protein [Pirellulaceae bacterium]